MKKKNLILVIMLSMVMASAMAFAGGASEGNAVEKFYTSAHGPSFHDQEEGGETRTDEWEARAEADAAQAEDEQYNQDFLDVRDALKVIAVYNGLPEAKQEDEDNQKNYKVAKQTVRNYNVRYNAGAGESLIEPLKSK